MSPNPQQAGCNTALEMSAEVQSEGGYDEDSRYYLNKVMEGLLDGYVGIVQVAPEPCTLNPEP